MKKFPPTTSAGVQFNNQIVKEHLTSTGIAMGFLESQRNGAKEQVRSYLANLIASAQRELKSIEADEEDVFAGFLQNVPQLAEKIAEYRIVCTTIRILKATEPVSVSNGQSTEADNLSKSILLRAELSASSENEKKP